MINTPFQNQLGFIPEGFKTKKVEPKKEKKPSILSKILGVDVSFKKNSYGISRYIKSFFNGIANIFKTKIKSAPVPKELNGVPIKRIKHLMYYKSPNTFRMSEEEMEESLSPSRIAYANACNKGPFDVNFDVIDIHNEFRHLNEKDLGEIMSEESKNSTNSLLMQDPDKPTSNFMLRYKPKIVKKINEEIE